LSLEEQGYNHTTPTLGLSGVSRGVECHSLTMSTEPGRVYQRKSDRSRALLSKRECLDVDFKRDIAGIEQSDLVAFANSPGGGAILVGVDEIDGPGGTEVGKVVGCPVGDRTRLQIINKAADCVPPVEIELYIEDLAATPFFRIEIPTGQQKPYCTKKGTYTIRGDGRTVALLPDHLLSIFVAVEGDAFVKRFQDATQAVSESLAEVQHQVEERTGSITMALDSLESRMQENLQSVYDVSDEANSQAMDIGTGIDDVWGRVVEIEDNVRHSYYEYSRLSTKLDAILEKLGLEDPYLVEKRTYVKERTTEYLTSKARLTKQLITPELVGTFHITGYASSEVRQWCVEAFEEVQAARKARKRKSKR
jgi:ATP-dependent DNA helicase RecG